MNSAIIGRRLLTYKLLSSNRQMINFLKFPLRNYSLLSKNSFLTTYRNPIFQTKNFCTYARTTTMGQNGEEYIVSRYLNLSEDADLTPYSNLGAEEIEKYILDTLMGKYGYSEDDIDYLLHFNSNVVLPTDDEHGGVVPKTIDYLVNRLGASKDEAKEILLRYPRYMNVDQEDIEERITFYSDLGIAGGELTMEDISEIFRANPFYFLCPLGTYPRLINEFKKYRFTKEETMKIFKEAGGIFGMKKNAFKGLFDSGKIFASLNQNFIHTN